MSLTPTLAVNMDVYTVTQNLWKKRGKRGKKGSSAKSHAMRLKKR